MRSILTLALKDIRLLSRDKFGMFWIFAFPLIYAVFFGSIMGGGSSSRGSLKLAIVDEDGSDASRAFLERIAQNEAVAIEREPAPDGTVEDEDDERPYRVHDLEAAREAVRKGDKVAYVRLLEGYGSSPFRMFDGEDGPMLEVGIDPARRAEGGMLQGVLVQSLFAGMVDGFGDRSVLLEQIEDASVDIADADDLTGAQKLVLEELMGSLTSFVEDADFGVFEEDGEGETGGDEDTFAALGANLVDLVDVARDREGVPRSTFEITFPTAIVWGLIGVAVSFAVAFVRERTEGTLLRLRIAPMGRAQLLAGKALGCYLMCLITMVVILGFGSLAMGVRFDSLTLLVPALLCTAACFTGLMMLSAVIGRTERAVSGASWGIMMPFAMIGGGMIPLIAMPEWLRKLSDISPFKWGILSIEGAMWRDFTAADMVLPCGLLLALGAAFFGMGVAIFRRAEI